MALPTPRRMVDFALDSAADSAVPAAPPLLDCFDSLFLQPTTIFFHMPHFFGGGGTSAGSLWVTTFGIGFDISGILLGTF